jgi:hypothetical protein
VDVDGHKFSGSTKARLLDEAATDDCCSIQLDGEIGELVEDDIPGATYITCNEVNKE